MSGLVRRLTIKNLIIKDDNCNPNILDTGRCFDKIDISKYFGPIVSTENLGEFDKLTLTTIKEIESGHALEKEVLCTISPQVKMSIKNQVRRNVLAPSAHSMTDRHNLRKLSLKKAVVMQFLVPYYIPLYMCASRYMH